MFEVDGKFNEFSARKMSEKSTIKKDKKHIYF